MAPATGDRAAHFPAIERKHGRPVAFYLAELADLGDAKYQDQIDLLRERHGFSQAHANAVVMYARGSMSSRRVDTPEAYFRDLGGDREVTIRAIFDAITSKYPELDLVIAWNQPMLKQGKDYVFGVSAAKGHLLLGPWGGISDAVRARLKGLEANKKTIRVPVDWKVDAPLLRLMVRERLAQLR
ncbi:MAG: iron chaperone [Actinomycetes bacterium]